MARVLFFIQLAVALVVLPLIPGLGADFAQRGLVFLAVVVAIPAAAVLAVHGPRQLVIAARDAWSPIPLDPRASARLWRLASQCFPASGMAAGLAVAAAAFQRISIEAPREAASVVAFCLVWGLLGFLTSRVLAEVVHRLESTTALVTLSPMVAARVGLTPREIQTAQTVLDGLTYRAAAHKLGISPSTVKTHILAVYEKTGAGNKIELLRWVEAESARLHQKADGRPHNYDQK